MASVQHTKFSSLVSTLFLVFCWLKPQGHYALKNLNHQPTVYHTVSVISLVPYHDQSNCNNVPSTKTGLDKRRASVRVSHRYGACNVSPQGGNKVKPSTNMAYEMLSHDEARVKSIKARLGTFNSNKDLFSDKKTTNLPAQRGIALGTGNYVVDIGLGSPAQQVTLAFDTGSDITWTQCEPCDGSCYPQKQPIFDPSKSTSYSNISCSNPLCSELNSAASIPPRCLSSTCVYGIQYGDKSITEGFFAKDTLTLSGADVLTNIPFGCGQNNGGLFGTTAGLIGLGRHPLSLVSQTAQKYGQVFSYCLPTASAPSRGHLSFGSSSMPANLAYTPFSSSDGSFYKIQMTAISVGELEVPISPTVFKSYGESIIDSGTVITRLPASIYRPMRDAFRNQMTDYKLAQPGSNFDTCYDFSNHTTVRIPTISFNFGSSSNVKVDVIVDGILLTTSNGVACLAFLEDSANIFGNSQQQTYEVVYDVAGSKIGFAPNAC